MTQLITPCIWLNSQAAQAAALSTTLFQELGITEAPQSGKVGQDFLDQPNMMMAEFEIAGLRMMGRRGTYICVQRRGISKCDLRNPRRGRPLLELTDCRWWFRGKLWLAQRPIWSLVADRADGAGTLDVQPRPRRRWPGTASHVENE